jgi:hypothetical protein
MDFERKIVFLQKRKSQLNAEKRTKMCSSSLHMGRTSIHVSDYVYEDDNDNDNTMTDIYKEENTAIIDSKTKLFELMERLRIYKSLEEKIRNEYQLKLQEKDQCIAELKRQHLLDIRQNT